MSKNTGWKALPKRFQNEELYGCVWNVSSVSTVFPDKKTEEQDDRIL